METLHGLNPCEFKALKRTWESHMSSRYHRALAVVIGSIATLTTASLSWWSGSPAIPVNSISSGVIILDGQELTPPYRVDVIGDRILVNERPVLELSIPVDEAPLSLETRHGVIQNALRQYGSLKQNQSQNVATARTLSFVQASNLVEDARIMEPGLIEIQFKDQPYPDVLELSDDQPIVMGPEARQNLLMRKRIMIEGFLRSDCLVILFDDIMTATEPGTAQERLTRIRQASGAGLTAAERTVAFKAAIGDSLVAELLSAKVVQP